MIVLRYSKQIKLYGFYKNCRARLLVPMDYSGRRFLLIRLKTIEFLLQAGFQDPLTGVAARACRDP